MVMALAAFLGTTEPALAAPVSRTGEQSANAGTATAHLSSAAFSDKICEINSNPPDDMCVSTNPYLKVYTTNTGDTAACTFTWKIYWNDGTTQIVTRDGGDEPLIFKAAHHYREPRKTTPYTVRWNAVSVTGGCIIGSGHGNFILVVERR